MSEVSIVTDALRWGDRRGYHNDIRPEFRYAATVKDNLLTMLIDQKYSLDAPDIMPAGSCTLMGLGYESAYATEQDYIVFQRVAIRP